jgi:ABC-type Fe3+ transport system permease subunit
VRTPTELEAQARSALQLAVWIVWAVCTLVVLFALLLGASHHGAPLDPHGPVPSPAPASPR